MELPRALGRFLKSPGMYVPRTDFDAAAAFLIGFDEARDGEVLAGFREWLVMKAGAGNNFGWPELVVRLAYPEPGSRPRVLPGNDQAFLVKLLFESLQDFWHDRESAQGPDEIRRRHSEWLRAQDRHQEVPAGQAG